MKFIVFAVAAAVFMAALGCATNEPPRPNSDSALGYDGGRIPVDDNVYAVRGVVVADVETLNRQTVAGRTTYTGLYFGPQFGGKGFVRLVVSSVDPATPIVRPEQIVLIKTSDTKASALLPGDDVTFRCRAQYEAVAAVRKKEHFDAAKLETWELDYCRLATPLVTISGE